MGIIFYIGQKYNEISVMQEVQRKQDVRIQVMFEEQRAQDIKIEASEIHYKYIIDNLIELKGILKEHVAITLKEKQ
jgi:hypothetical protein